MMAANEIHKGDIGTPFVATIKDDTTAVDVSSATVTKNLIFVKPTGEKLTKAASFDSDGTDGKISWTTTAATDLDVVGDWQVQGYVVLTSGTWSSDIYTFTVYPNL